MNTNKIIKIVKKVLILLLVSLWLYVGFLGVRINQKEKELNELKKELITLQISKKKKQLKRKRCGHSHKRKYKRIKKSHEKAKFKINSNKNNESVEVSR